MASAANDALRTRTVEGTVNLYDNQRVVGTAADKATAARVGSTKYHMLAPWRTDHFISCPAMQHDDHFLDTKGVNSNDIWFERKKKFAGMDKKLPLAKELSCTLDHPKVDEANARKAELLLSQIENPQDFRKYQERRHEFRPETPPFRRKLDERKPKVRTNVVTARTFGALRKTASDPMLLMSGSSARGRPMFTTAEAMSDPKFALRAARQMQNDSACVSNVKAKNSYSNSLMLSKPGHDFQAMQRSISTDRMVNAPYTVARKTSHYSGEDRLTKADPFFMRPRLAGANNSVKYNIITNATCEFAY